MKKLGSLLLCFGLFLLILVQGSAHADGIKVLLNGKAIQFDQPPMIVSNRTMVPLRAIFEALGCDVSFIQEDQTIVGVKDETKILMRIGSTDMLKLKIKAGAELGNLAGLGFDNMQEIYLDAPPMIVGSRTLVPARAISEALGVTVGWDSASATVTLTCPAQQLSQNSDTAFYPAFYNLVYGRPVTARGELLFLNEEGKVLLDRSGIKSASAKQSPGAKTYYIELALTDSGRQKLAGATLELSKRTDGKNRMTIQLDDMVLFSPRISGQIDSALFDIGGVFPKSIAQELAKRINQGIKK